MKPAHLCQMVAQLRQMTGSEHELSLHICANWKRAPFNCPPATQPLSADRTPTSNTSPEDTIHIHLDENPARHAACESSETMPYVSPKHRPQPADRQARPLPSHLGETRHEASRGLPAAEADSPAGRSPQHEVQHAHPCRPHPQIPDRDAARQRRQTATASAPRQDTD